MKKLSLYLILLAPIVGFGQSQNKKIQALWNTIQEQEQNAEIKSMLPNIVEVKALSKKVKDYPSLIKAMFFEARITILTKEDKEYSIDTIIEQFEAEGKAATGVQKAVFDIYLATLYDLYYQANRYKIRNRTNLDNPNGTSISFWTSNDFSERIQDYYLKGIAIAQQDKSATIGSWGDVFVKEDASKLDWSKISVYNLIRLEYLNYLTDNTSNDAEVIAKKEALETSLLADLKNSKQTSLYLYVSLFLLNKSPESAAAKKAVCETLLQDYPTETIVYDGYAAYVDTAELVALADKVQTLFPNTPTATRLAGLKKDAEASRFNVQLKKYAIDGETIPLYIDHRNNDKVYVQVLRIDNASKVLDMYQLNSLDRYYELAQKYTVESSYSVDLKSFEDYKNHQTIVALQPLKAGRYYVVLSDTPFDRLKKGESDIQATALNVTPNLIVANEQKLRAYNRKTGQPLVNAEILISNGPERSNAKTYWETMVKTDGNGEYSFDFVEDSRNLFFNVKGEEVYYSKWVYNRKKSDATTEDNTVLFSGIVLTDRSIYRPGQVLYFKTIVTQEKNAKEHVAANQNVTAILRNTNYDEVSKLSLSTNEFGSANGQFVLPTSGLLGNYSIVIEMEDKSIAEFDFSVEEYKRPKFAVTLDKPKGIYKLDDEVTVLGNAKAFMGATLNQATVVYRVERNEEWPYWIWRGFAPYHYAEPETMVQGETTTDEQGNFAINFKALAAKAKTEENSPRTYRYSVYADVTDSNGETHSIAEDVLVGDKNIELTVDLAPQVNEKGLSKFKIATQNLNAVDYPSKGELAIYALDRPYTPRLLDGVNYGKTDYEQYDYKDFVQKMPYTEYANELDASLWKEGKQVFTVSFDTAISKEITFDGAKKLPSGSYLVKGFVLENGEKTDIVQNVTLKNNYVPAPLTELVEIQVEDKTYNSGEKAKVVLKAAEEHTLTVVEVYANGKKVQSKALTVGKKPTTFEVPVKKEYKQLSVNVTAIKHGIAKVATNEIKVTEGQEDLKLTVESFRDKIEPGAKEKWSLSIAGAKTDKVVAEVLATMYDASLDQFQQHALTGRLKEPSYFFNTSSFSAYDFYSLREKQYANTIEPLNYVGQSLSIDTPVKFNVYGFGFNSPMRMYTKSRSVGGMLEGKAAGVSVHNETLAFNVAPTAGSSDVLMDSFEDNAGLDEVVVTGYGGATKTPNTSFNPRKNLKETAFFYPTLRTDEHGNVKVEFTMPDALTQWKFMAFAHTKDLKQGGVEKLVQTQKELMVVPNLPRFFREGDQVVLSTKVVNVSAKARSGKATLHLFNAFTMEALEEKTVSFDVLASGSTSVSWEVAVPKDVQAITCRIVATDGEYSDGEEAVLAVLSNRIMVTETMPISIKEGQNKIFTFDKYEEKHSASIENYKLTLELTASPVWNAIFALPSLQEGDSNNIEQLYSKVFANAVATQILHSNPQIKTVFDQWNAKGELVSKLEQNEELKSILISETPWVREAEDEGERMKRLAILFDLNKMRTELTGAIQMLEQQQNDDGGFPWYSGGQSDQYITQTVVAGFGDLLRMGVLKSEWMDDLDIDYDGIVKKAIDYMDNKQHANYVDRSAKSKETDQPIIGMQYMYARSFFLNEYKINEKYAPMIASMRKGIENESIEGSLYQQGMRAIVAKRFGFTKTAQNIVKYIVEASVESNTDGMYWKENKAGWLWYQSPVEVQALLIEALNEVDAAKYVKQIEEMKVWLMKNKQTSAWTSTKATTKAVYALLNTGKSWTDTNVGLEVKVGGYPLDIAKDAQMGSGYIKHTWTKSEMTPKQGVVELTKTSPGISYGAMYWQYYENLNSVSAANSALQMTKELFVKTNTDKGQVLKAITATTPIKVGDVVTIRLTLQVDQDMNYVHLKDMRASGFEPTNVLSGYKWKGEFGYYEETRDAATNFFISRLRKGNYVFEYDLRANNAGVFSNGITTLQNMYAPEMSAHSEGIKVQIAE